MEQAIGYIFSFVGVGFGLGMVLSAAGYAVSVLLGVITKVVMKGV